MQWQMAQNISVPIKIFGYMQLKPTLGISGGRRENWLEGYQGSQNQGEIRKTMLEN